MPGPLAGPEQASEQPGTSCLAALLRVSTSAGPSPAALLGLSSTHKVLGTQLSQTEAQHFQAEAELTLAEDACAVPKHHAAWPWRLRTQARRISCQHMQQPSVGQGAPCRAHAARRPAAAERAGGARRSGPRRARPSGRALLRRPPARAGLGVQHAVAGAPRAVRGRADLGAGGRRQVVRRRTVRPVRRRAKGHQVRAPPRPRQPPEPKRARSKQLCCNPLSARRA